MEALRAPQAFGGRLELCTTCTPWDPVPAPLVQNILLLEKKLGTYFESLINFVLLISTYFELSYLVSMYDARLDPW